MFSIEIWQLYKKRFCLRGKKVFPFACVIYFFFFCQVLSIVQPPDLLESRPPWRNQRVFITAICFVGTRSNNFWRCKRSRTDPTHTTPVKNALLSPLLEIQNHLTKRNVIKNKALWNRALLLGGNGANITGPSFTDNTACSGPGRDGVARASGLVGEEAPASSGVAVAPSERATSQGWALPAG